MATAATTGIEKYHKGYNLVILLYCEQLSRQLIITVSAAVWELLCPGACLEEKMSSGSSPFLNIIFVVKLFSSCGTY